MATAKKSAPEASKDTKSKSAKPAAETKAKKAPPKKK